MDLDRTPLCGIQRLADASWPLAALLMGQRIVVLEYSFRLEIREFFVAVIAKNKALRPSPTNTNAPCGILSLVICYSGRQGSHNPRPLGGHPKCEAPSPRALNLNPLRLLSMPFQANRGRELLVDPGQH